MPAPGLAALAPPAVGAFLVLFDINRLQPWCYQYLLMFVVLALMQWDKPDSRRSKAAWAGCACIVVGIYFWSGTHKLNMTFAHDIFPFVLQPLGIGVVASLKPFWFIAPILESSIGILLLIPRTRVFGLAGALVMHSFLLGVLGPLGHDYNSTVWPWNFWAAVIAFILFLRNDQRVLRTAWAEHAGKAMVILFGVLPGLNYFNRWDGFLSASFYSGKLRDGWIYLTANGAEHLPAAYKSDKSAFAEDSPGRFRLDITQWAMSQLNVPPYAEPRAYVGIMKRLEEAGVPDKDMTLLVRDWVPLTSSDRTYSQEPFK